MFFVLDAMLVKTVICFLRMFSFVGNLKTIGVETAKIHNNFIYFFG